MQPIPKFDAVATLDLVRRQTGADLAYDGQCPGGEVGAAYVRWPDGRRSVLGGGDPTKARYTEIARRAGIPAPRYQLTGDGWVVQECLPGQPPEHVDDDLLAQLLHLNGLQRDLLIDTDEAPKPLYLTESGPGFCVHEPLDRHGGRTRRLLAWVREVGAETDTMTGADLAHLDFHPGNVLVDGGRVTGVIDWDGAGRGDRHFDLVTLRFSVPRLDEHLRSVVPEARLRLYWAHMSLRLVDWAIRHHGESEVEHWLDVAESGIG